MPNTPYDNTLGYTVKGLLLDTSLNEATRLQLIQELCAEAMARLLPLMGFGPEDKEAMDQLMQFVVPIILAKSANSPLSSN